MLGAEIQSSWCLYIMSLQTCDIQLQETPAIGPPRRLSRIIAFDSSV